MAIKKYTIQSIDNFQLNIGLTPGLNTQSINPGSSLLGLVNDVYFKPAAIPTDNGKLYYDGSHFYVRVGGASVPIENAVSSNAKMYSGSVQTIGDASATIINLDNKPIENNITADTSNKKVTITQAGYYLISGKIAWNAPVAAKSYTTILFKNTTELSRLAVQSSSTDAFASFLTDLVYLDVGDYIQMKGFQNSGGNIDTKAGADDTYLLICKI